MHYTKHNYHHGIPCMVTIVHGMIYHGLPGYYHGIPLLPWYTMVTMMQIMIYHGKPGCYHGIPW